MFIFTMLYILLLVAILAVSYYIYCVPQEKIAAKLGDDATWMAYVPFARNAQRMSMVDMPMWKMFFVGGLFTYLFGLGIIFVICWLFATLNPLMAIVMGVILVIVHGVFYILSSYDFYCRIADNFGFDKVPTAFIMMFVPAASSVISYLIALSDRYYVGAAPAPSAAPAPNAAPAGSAFQMSAGSDDIGLMGISGMYAGAKFTMKATDEFVIGRDSTLSNIIISANGDKVSRRHCTVRFVPATCSYEVTDFSSNGTFYGNTRLLKGQPTSIARGTTIVIGDKLNQFKLM